jgi:hypothetical protein
MKIYLIDQRKNLPLHLEQLKNVPVMPYSKSTMKEKVTILSSGKKANLAAIDTHFFFDYKIFPGNIMSFLTQWNFENREMRVGDTIVQQAYIPPIKTLSQKFVFGVRISEIIREEKRTGFSYETLAGHDEKGISIFTLEESDEKEIVIKIQTFSKPGNLLSSIMGTVFTLPYQAYCTRAALLNVKRQIEETDKFP